MKRYILLLAIAISSCATQTTAPVPPPAHPFPSAFKQVSANFSDLPEHWNNQSSSYYLGQWSSTQDSGSCLCFWGSWSFEFTDSSFSKSGDTLRARQEQSHSTTS